MPFRETNFSASDLASNLKMFEKEIVMLVLSRRPDEKIVFPELGISIKVIRTKGNQVRLGIQAPETIRILRGELAFEADSTEEICALT